MATSTLTNVPVIRERHWRDYIKITRIGVFSVFFVLMGLWMLLGTARQFGPEVTTRLTFESVSDRQAGRAAIAPLDVPVVTYAVIVGLLYLGGGVIGLLPFKDTGLKRLRHGWLLLNGLLIIPTVLILAAAGQSTNATTMVAATFQLATPIVIGALAGLWCERSGVVNIAIEGMMLTGACFGFITFTLILQARPPQVSPQVWTQQAQFWGVLVAIVSGGIMALLHAWLAITFRTDQIVSGVVINIMALGITSFMRREILLSSEAGREETLRQIRIPPLADIPVMGEVLFNGRPIFYCMFVLLIVTHIVLYYTRWGLRTRAVGENPHAADTLGINVIRNRWVNVFIGGLIAGLAGAWFSLETVGGFDDNMTSGRGFIALAAMIFGKWTPFGAAAGGLLFGFASALDTRFQILGVNVPPQFVQMTPYLVTMIVLAGLVGKAVSPKADGVPYSKE